MMSDAGKHDDVFMDSWCIRKNIVTDAKLRGTARETCRVLRNRSDRLVANAPAQPGSELRDCSLKVH